MNLFRMRAQRGPKALSYYPENFQRLPYTFYSSTATSLIPSIDKSYCSSYNGCIPSKEIYTMNTNNIPADVAAAWGLVPQQVVATECTKKKAPLPKRERVPHGQRPCFSNTGYKYITYTKSKDAFNVVIEKSVITGKRVSTSRVAFSAALAIRKFHKPGTEKYDTHVGEFYELTKVNRDYKYGSQYATSKDRGLPEG